MTSRMDINAATTQYERWMRRYTPIFETQLRDKHEQMRADLLGFCRATFYRWMQLWPAVWADCQWAPRVLAVGICTSTASPRGVTTRAGSRASTTSMRRAHCPYTNDLIRLAAGARIVTDDEQLRIKYRQACDAILEGYWHTIKTAAIRWFSPNARSCSVDSASMN